MGVRDRDEEDVDFAERIKELNDEMEALHAEARTLKQRIAGNVTELLEASKVARD